jgi:hypothetical protein
MTETPEPTTDEPETPDTGEGDDDTSATESDES